MPKNINQENTILEEKINNLCKSLDCSKRLNDNLQAFEKKFF